MFMCKLKLEIKLYKFAVDTWN